MIYFQIFKDVFDPLNIVTVNPNLEPSNEHSLYIRVIIVLTFKKEQFFCYLNYSATNNEVLAKKDSR